MTSSPQTAHRLLLVDDEPNVIGALRRALHKETYEIVSATSAQDALDVLGRTPVDVVVADQDMPGMKGTEFLARVAKTYPDTVRFMLTGKPTLDVAVQAINEGTVSRFFTKPANGVDLATSIRQALQHKDLMTEAFRLLRRCKEQSSVLDSLEQAHPGITRLDKDDCGALVIEETCPGDYDQLIEAMRETLGE